MRDQGQRRLPRMLVALAAVVVLPSLLAAPDSQARPSAAPRLADGTAVREENSFLIYKMVGGAKVWFVNAAEFSALGYTLDRVVVVPKGALASVPNIPPNGTLLRERSSFAVFVMDGGKRRWIANRSAFDAAGYTLNQVQVVANGALGGIPRGQDLAPASLDPPTASAAGPRCNPTRLPFGYADLDQKDGNVVGIPGEGWRTYYVGVGSWLYRCGGYVKAVTYVWVDSRWLPLGFNLILRISTRRSDGRWYGKLYSISTAKNFGEWSVTHYRGIGGGLRVTDVHVKHFPGPGQTVVPTFSTAKAHYHRWNGPEAGPGLG